MYLACISGETDDRQDSELSRKEKWWRPSHVIDQDYL